jgi:hypothetical protein
MQCIENSVWIKDILDKALIPFVIGALSYVLFRGLDEMKKRRTFSTLGVIIIDCLLEEVGTGLDNIQKTIKNVPFVPLPMPFKSWSGVNTLPDDVMLRIISVSKDVKPIGSFNPKDIRKHTKNYFDHMCSQWNNFIILPNVAHQNIAKTFKDWPEAAKGVKDMLEQTKQLLEDNSKKWLPK